jgi:tetratricopeptide (TPR) repeat protein
MAYQSDYIWKHVWIQIAKHAEILFQMGNVKKSLLFLKKAEGMQKEHDKVHQFLYGVLSFKYFDLVLDIIEKDISNSKNILDSKKQLLFLEKKILKIFPANKMYKIILHLSLGYLTYSRILLIKSILVNKHIIDKSIEYSDLAEEGIRESGRIEYIPYVIRHKSHILSILNEPKEALSYLDDALDISISTGMKLHQVDAIISKATIGKIFKNTKVYTNSSDKAYELIEKIGYLRRKVYNQPLVSNLI